MLIVRLLDIPNLQYPIIFTHNPHPRRLPITISPFLPPFPDARSRVPSAVNVLYIQGYDSAEFSFCQTAIDGI